MKNKLTYIIDDDKLTVKLMSILIFKNKFCDEIESFHNPQFALDKLKHCFETNAPLPDTILLDLNMPVMDGWQFLDEFLLLPIEKKIVIFIMTSSIDPNDIDKAKKYSVVKDYIDKPVTAQKLDLIRKLIEETN